MSQCHDDYKIFQEQPRDEVETISIDDERVDQCHDLYDEATPAEAEVEPATSGPPDQNSSAVTTPI